MTGSFILTRQYSAKVAVMPPVRFVCVQHSVTLSPVSTKLLRSADTRTLVVSRTRSSFGDGTFAAAGPQVWNSLQPNLRLCGLSYGQFRRLLKTFLFGQ